MTKGSPSRAAASGNNGQRSKPRVRLALGLAILGLAAALVGAIGPSEPVRSTYAWPPRTLPDTTPSTVWYTPLVLMRHRPANIAARFPCSASPALSRAGNPVTVLSTVRHTDSGTGLVVLHNDHTLTVWVNGVRLARAELAQLRANCTYELRVTQDTWSLTGGPDSIVRNGSLESGPIVSGLFSELDLTHASRPRIEITTVAYASDPTRRQAIAWALAVLAAVTSLLLVAVDRRPRLARVRSIGARLGHAHPADAVVALVLAAWWILSPLVWDDGWIVARERAYSESGGFTNYYTALGANVPNDYWLEWLQRWTVEASDSLVVWRLPALVSLSALWILCRWILSGALGPREGGVEIWAMTAAFLGCSVAWGMTLRPEPFTALLVTGVLACVVTFRLRPAAAPLALAAVLIPLSVAAHQTGIAALAPLLAIAPSLWTWLRSNRTAAAALALSSGALLVVLTTVGADLAVRLADSEATATFGGSGERWFEEWRRYDRLGWGLYATPPRRGTVALIALVALFFLLRRVRTRDVLDVPARSLIIALPLLIVTWSKLPWHFGVLIGFAAVAVGTEAHRHRGEAERATSLSIRALLFITAMVAAGGWALAVRTIWHFIDLGTLQWTFGFERHQPLSLGFLTAILPEFVLFTLLLVGVTKRGDTGLYTAPWRVASWAAPILMVPLLAITFVVFSVDAVRSPWTIRRQNLETLSGQGSCGLADHVVVAFGTGRGVRLARLVERKATRVLTSPALLPYFPCARQPGLKGGVAQPPDLLLLTYFDGAPFVYGASPFDRVLDLYRVRPLRIVGTYKPKELRVYGVEKTIPGAVVLPPTRL